MRIFVKRGRVAGFIGVVGWEGGHLNQRERLVEWRADGRSTHGGLWPWPMGGWRAGEPGRRQLKMCNFHKIKANILIGLGSTVSSDQRSVRHVYLFDTFYEQQQRRRLFCLFNGQRRRQRRAYANAFFSAGPGSGKVRIEN